MFSEKEREKKVCGMTQTMQKFIDRKKSEIPKR